MSRHRSSYAARRQNPRNVVAIIILSLFGVGVVAIGLFLLADQLGTSPLTADTGPEDEQVATSGDGNEETAGDEEREDAETATPPPPDPDDMESGREIAEGWAELWQAEDYEGLYELISEESKSIIDRDEFVERYEGIAEELGQTGIEVEVTDEIEDALRYTLSVERESSRVDEFEDEILLPMIEEAEGRPRVDWTPSVIIDDLSDGFVRWRPDVPQRGRILDRHDRPLAHLGQISKVGVIQGDVEDEGAMLQELSDLLEMSEEDIESRYSGGEDDWFMPVKDYPAQMDEDLREQITDIPGVSVQEWPERVYPAGEDAAHVVGYLTEVSSEELPDLIDEGYAPGDVLGRAGVEAWGEEHLAGERGGRMIIVGPEGSERETIAEVQSEPSSDIRLTIDIDLQIAAMDALGDETGSIVIVDPADGAILAMASKPTFDPNGFILGHSAESWEEINDPDRRPLENRATTFTYPLGSVFKSVTMAAGMEHLGMTPESTIECPAEFSVDDTDQVWSDWTDTGQGTLSLHNALVQSCNTVFYQIGADLDRENDEFLPEAARGFGYGSETGLEALRELPGTVPDPDWKAETVGDFWARGDAVNLSIGQGYFEATPLQVASAYAAIANGGTLYEPYLVDEVVSLEGETIYEHETEEKGSIPFPDETLSAIRNAMRDVTQAENGTARDAFQDAPIPTAGKTGTAETSQEEPHSWFAMLAPDSEAEITAVSMVEYGGEGSRVAAPIARQVLDAWATMRE